MYNNLTTDEKIKLKNYCDKKYGSTICYSEIGEPMYMDEQGNLINIKIIIDLIFFVKESSN